MGWDRPSCRPSSLSSSTYKLVNNITDNNISQVWTDRAWWLWWWWLIGMMINTVINILIKWLLLSGLDWLSLKRSSQLCFRELVVVELSVLSTYQMLLLGTYDDDNDEGSDVDDDNGDRKLVVAELSVLLTFQLLLLGTYMVMITWLTWLTWMTWMTCQWWWWQISDQGHIAYKAEAPRGSLGWLWRSQRQDQVWFKILLNFCCNRSPCQFILIEKNSKNFLFSCQV